MFVYWSNEAKSPSFEANNFKLWIRSHGSYIKIDFDRKQDLDDSQIDDVYSTEIRTRTKNLDIDEYYNIIDVMNSYFDKNFRKNNLQLIKVEGDEYEYVFSKTKS